MCHHDGLTQPKEKSYGIHAGQSGGSGDGTGSTQPNPDRTELDRSGPTSLPVSCPKQRLCVFDNRRLPTIHIVQASPRLASPRPAITDDDNKKKKLTAVAMM